VASFNDSHPRTGLGVWSRRYPIKADKRKKGSGSGFSENRL